MQDISIIYCGKTYLIQVTENSSLELFLITVKNILGKNSEDIYIICDRNILTEDNFKGIQVNKTYYIAHFTFEELIKYNMNLRKEEENKKKQEKENKERLKKEEENKKKQEKENKEREKREKQQGFLNFLIKNLTQKEFEEHLKNRKNRKEDRQETKNFLQKKKLRINNLI